MVSKKVKTFLISPTTQLHPLPSQPSGDKPPTPTTDSVDSHFQETVALSPPLQTTSTFDPSREEMTNSNLGLHNNSSTIEPTMRSICSPRPLPLKIRTFSPTRAQTYLPPPKKYRNKPPRNTASPSTTLRDNTQGRSHPTHLHAPLTSLLE